MFLFLKSNFIGLQGKANFFFFESGLHQPMLFLDENQGDQSKLIGIVFEYLFKHRPPYSTALASININIQPTQFRAHARWSNFNTFQKINLIALYHRDNTSCFTTCPTFLPFTVYFIIKL